MAKALRLFSFILSLTFSTAEHTLHRMHPRYLHTARGIEAGHVHRHMIEPVANGNSDKFVEGEVGSASRYAALSVLESIDAVELQRRDIDNDNAELQSNISELELAFQSLVGLLSTEYGLSLNSSCLTTTSSDLSTSSTLTTLTGSITATATTYIEISSSLSATSSSLSSPPSISSSTYTFDPMSISNVAVYYGQTDQTSTVSLATICADPNIDIVILAFLNNFYSPYPSGQYPALNMGSHCWAASSAQSAAGASGLIDCVSDGFADLVRQCQTSYGKKVFLSLGGAVGYSDTRIPSAAAANSLADTIWDLFLGGSGLESIRPFGDVVLDGIDIDNEDPANAVYLPVLIKSLRQNFAAAQGTKSFYLSAAPQCPRPDQSIPAQSLQTQIDFIWPQFYNNPSCNLDSDSFIVSLQAWASDLRGHAQGNFGEVSTGGFVDIGNGISSPRLLVGTPAFANAGSGFVEGSQFESIVAQIQNTSLGGQFHEPSPFGGFMFWDGAYGVESTATSGIGKSYMEIVKDAFT